MIYEHAENTPLKTALVFNDRKLDYFTFNRRINKLANGLKNLGVGQNVKVAVMLPNGFEVWEANFAIVKVKGVCVPINYNLKSEEISYILDNSDAEALIVSEKYMPLIKAVLPKLSRLQGRVVVVGEAEKEFLNYETFLRGFSDEEPEEPAEQTGGHMFYTSGTTGMPKGVYRPDDHRVFLRRVQRFQNLYGFSGQDVHLLTSPNYHSAPNIYTRANLFIGATVVMMDRFEPEHFLRLIHEYQVTTTHVVPTHFRRLLRLLPEKREKYDHKSLRVVVHAAEFCPVTLKRQIMDFFGMEKIFEYWASTEVIGTYITPQDWLRKPGSVGRPSAGTVLKIFDEEGNELPSGQIGDIYSYTEGVQPFEYYKDEEKTKSVYRGKFVRSGDMGYLDEEGFLFLADRSIDMVISGGVNIYPVEIESVLLTHPKIKDAAVIGVPDEDWGEALKAFVVPEEQAELSENEVKDYCRQHLANYKCPRTVAFVPSLPRDESGKLFKRLLRGTAGRLG